MQYLPYKIASFCSHDSQKSQNNYVDLMCNNNDNLIHRVSQFGRFCNKCAATITKSVSALEECLCCEQKLENYLADQRLCQHPNKTIDQIMIKCLDNKDQFHEIPFKSKVCEQCFSKIRAAFMFSHHCVVCAEKQEEIFENLQKTLTLPAYHFYEKGVQLCYKKKFSEEETKQEIQLYCLAAPRPSTKSKIISQIEEIEENLESYHQSKRYQLYPKCKKHRNSSISVCNNCLVGILNIDRCPYGCAYEQKKKNKGKVDNIKIYQSGFVSMYPKMTKNYQYLQLFVIRLIDQPNRLVRWENSLRKIRLSQNCKVNLKQIFTLYASTIQLTPDHYLFTGGAKGPHIFSMKPTPNAFIIQVSKNRKQFTVKNACQMKYQRSSHALARNDDFVYAVGGYNNETMKYLSTCEKYNTKTDKWEQIAGLNVERSKANSFFHKNYLYVFGGLTTNPDISKSLGERYDEKKNEWESLNFEGYGYPYVMGSATLNNIYKIPELDNVILFGGSNYESMTYFLQELVIDEKNFKMNPSNMLHKMLHSREGAALALMNSQKESEKTVIVFGGLEQYEPLLTFDAVRIKLQKKQNKTEIIPFFVFDEIQTGSFRLMLRENATQTYEYMFETLVEQKILDKGKLEKGAKDIYKSEFNVHLIEKMWYGIGKSMISISL